MKNKKLLWTIRIALIVLTVACAVTIFCFSSQTVTESKQTSDTVVDKVIEVEHPDYEELSEAQKISINYYTEINIRTYAHMIIYCALGGLVLLTLLSFRINLLISSSIALGGTLLYALSDEWHQTFVEGRNGSIADVAKDSIGIICGVAAGALAFIGLVYLVRYLRKKKSVSVEAETQSNDTQESTPDSQ